MDEFKTIEKEVESELIEKKSKFIASIFKVNSVKEADEKLLEVKKRYYDAKHNCYTYRVIENDRIIEKSSDDGEPSGTAGAPMLNILKQNNLCNVLIVVTRYFGGILLGTGGLVRAYSRSTQDVIEKSNIVLKESGYKINIEIEYKELEKLKYFCKKNEIKITNIQYLENIIVTIELRKDKEQLIRKSDNLNFEYLKYNIIEEKFI